MDINVATVTFGFQERLFFSQCDTVDGSEILRSPVEGKVGFSHDLQGFSTIPDGAGFLPPTVSSC